MTQSQILTFEIEGKTFGLLAGQIVEVIRAVKARPIDGAPGIDAVFNFRGAMVPLVDLRGRLSMPPRAVSASDHFIVVQLDEDEKKLAALKVDRARALIEVNVDELETAHRKNNFAGVAKLDSDIIVIYEVQKLIDDIDFNIDYDALMN